eukprot:g1357.t1
METAAPPGLVPEAPFVLEEKSWYYKDLDSKVWGPFKRDQMDMWYSKNKLTATLPVSISAEGPFTPIERLGNNPFLKISIESLRSSQKWWYKVNGDADAKIFGPFPSLSMRTWYVNEKLPERLLVTWYTKEGPFVPLFVLPHGKFSWATTAPATLDPSDSNDAAAALLRKMPSRRRMTTLNQTVETVSKMSLESGVKGGRREGVARGDLEKASSSRRLTTLFDTTNLKESDDDECSGAKHPKSAMLNDVDFDLSKPPSSSVSNVRSPGPVMNEATATNRGPSDWAAVWRREVVRSFVSVVSDISDFAGISWQGACPWRPKPNQDRAIVFQCDKTKSFVAGVFDGHGPVGHLVSDFVIRHIERAIVNDPAWETDVEATLRRVVPAINESVSKRSGIDCTLSGTTLVLAVVRDGRITTCNLGDSTLSAVIRDDTATNVVQLTKDHTPVDPSERARIVRSGGLVYAVDPDGTGPQGPLRVWRKQKDGPGIAMSRSIGDVMATNVGVISDPEIVTMTRKEIAKQTGGGTCVGLLLASDALYEFMDGPDVAKAGRFALVTNMRCDLTRNLKALADAVQRIWTKRESGYVDDTTLIFLKFC